MMNGVVVGLVVDNVDPDSNGKIKCKYPTDHESPPETWWLRLMSPMAGKKRGLVMLPDVGTEVLIGFAYRTMAPYIVGALYNGAEDKPKPYANEDGNDDHRRFWSRNSQWLDIDDTPGAERIEFINTTENDAIYTELHSANKVVTMKTKKDFIVEAVETVSFKCKDFKLEASNSIAMEACMTGVFTAGASAKWESGTTQLYKAGKVDINGGTPGQPTPPKALPPHKHPPTK